MYYYIKVTYVLIFSQSVVLSHICLYRPMTLLVMFVNRSITCNHVEAVMYLKKCMCVWLTEVLVL